MVHDFSKSSKNGCLGLFPSWKGLLLWLFAHLGFDVLADGWLGGANRPWGFRFFWFAVFSRKA